MLRMYATLLTCIILAGAVGTVYVQFMTLGLGEDDQDIAYSDNERHWIILSISGNSVYVRGL